MICLFRTLRQCWDIIIILQGRLVWKENRKFKCYSSALDGCLETLNASIKFLVRHLWCAIRRRPKSIKLAEKPSWISNQLAGTSLGVSSPSSRSCANTNSWPRTPRNWEISSNSKARARTKPAQTSKPCAMAWCAKCSGRNPEQRWTCSP